jgi:hypothetical protein
MRSEGDVTFGANPDKRWALDAFLGQGPTSEELTTSSSSTI